MTNLIETLDQIEDTRSHINKIHPMTEIVFLVIVAVLSGAEGWTSINLFGKEKLNWLRKYLPYEQGIASKDTIARTIGIIRPEQLSLVFIEFINQLRQQADSDMPVIAIDGKSLKHSYIADDKTQKLSMLHSIGAYNVDQGILLGSLKSKSKKYEPNTVTDLLDLLILDNCIVTADAMNCKTDVAEKIRDNNADYVLQIKNNQALLKREIVANLHKVRRDNPELIKQNYLKQVDAGHGRIETREYIQLPITDWFDHTEEWKDLQSLVEVTRTVDHGDKTTHEVSYYISSLPVEVGKVAPAIRSHWGIENSLHYVLDVTFKEDSLCLSSKYSAEIMALLRRLSFNLAKLSPLKGSMKSRLQQVAWSDKARDALLLGVM